ncbi:MAG: Na/Pi symporter, partial [Limnochordia bacterium]
MGIVIGVAGGLAMFLYGLQKMADGLQRMAGRKLTNILNFLTSNTFVGVLSGLVLTVLVQSSSTTTVMLVGFVKAGLLSLEQTIGPILGANI